MKLQKGQKIVLSIILSFFGILIIFALFVKCNHKKNALDVPGGSKNSQALENKINEYYETNKESDESISAKSNTLNGVYTALITSYKKGIDNYKIPIYKAYYYSTSDSRELARSEVLSRFNYTEENINSKILDYFESLYNQEVAQGYVDKNECDFKECYLSFYRDLNSLDNYSLYAENGELYVYISFDPDSLIGDKEFFDKLNYDYYKIEIN